MEGKRMNYAVYNIALDIHKTGSQVALSMIRGESKRKIVISLTENGRPYKISEGTKIELGHFTALKPDNNFIYNACEIDEENNVIIYYVTTQTTAAPGEVKCQIKLSDNDGELLFTPQFSIIVADTLYNEEPILASSEEFNALTAYVADLQKKLANGEFKGDKGDKGDVGDRGPQGVPGNTGPAGKDADVSALSPAIVCTEKGTAIAVSDSSESIFEVFSIYGKSTQNGTPTPDVPVDIVSVGDDGEFTTNIHSKNIIEPIMANGTINGVTITNNKDGSFTLNGTSTGNASFRIDQTTVSGADKLKSYKGKYYISLRDAKGNINPQGLTFYMMQNETYKVIMSSTVRPTADVDTTKAFLYIEVTPGITLSNLVVYPQLELGSSMTSWEKPFKQLVNIATPLRAIPVTDSSLATYTDANGQMWCADEIDLERGVYIQRTKSIVFDGTESWSISGKTLANGNDWYFTTAPYTDAEDTDGGRKVICSHYPHGLINNGNEIQGIAMVWKYVRIRWGTETTVASWKAWLSAQKANGNPVKVVYRLANPIETPLTSEQIAAYKALKTNYPSTTILNDENAFMKVSYRADTKKFIQRMAGATSQISSVTLSASKWVGSASPYTQVVTISGVTPNSKVDLNPTVEQLNIFHNKDISFVAGNKNGIITVYCIGQKPTQDYTMQTTITEVVVND